MKTKSVLLMLLSATMLAACAPKEEKTQTSTDGTTVTTTVDENTDTTAADSTMNNGDNATVGEEMDMAAGDGIEGLVMNWDGTAKTFGLNEDDKNYNVSVTDTTEYVGTDGSTMTADDFFGTDQTDKKIAVEGEINGESLVASKITMSDDTVNTDVDSDPASDAPNNE